jgi:hypothetical protein
VKDLDPVELGVKFHTLLKGPTEHKYACGRSIECLGYRRPFSVEIVSPLGSQIAAAQLTLLLFEHPDHV